MGNRTRNLPTCSNSPEPSTLLRDPPEEWNPFIYLFMIYAYLTTLSVAPRAVRQQNVVMNTLEVGNRNHCAGEVQPKDLIEDIHSPDRDLNQIPT
jgi:hypothetical protein